MTRLETTAIHPKPFTSKAGRVLCAAVVALATACGNSSDPTTPVVNPAPRPQPGNPGPPTPPGITYSVVVKTVDTQGQPIAGVSVRLLCRSDLSADTGSDGTASFNCQASQTGADIALYASLTGYHGAYRMFRLEAASSPSPSVQQLTLMRTDEAQLVFRGVTSQVSADASSVVVSADIAVVGLNGNPIAGLSAADFTVPPLDCYIGVSCILEPSGAPLSTGYWVPSQRDPVQVTLLGAGPSTLYRVRYVLEAERGMFTAGRTVLTVLSVRVGADTWLSTRVDVRL